MAAQILCTIFERGRVVVDRRFRKYHYSSNFTEVVSDVGAKEPVRIDGATLEVGPWTKIEVPRSDEIGPIVSAFGIKYLKIAELETTEENNILSQAQVSLSAFDKMMASTCELVLPTKKPVR